jgi:hypothetical protein
MRPAIYQVVILFTLLSACTTYEEEIIPGNVAPPDPTVYSTIYEDYINRSYILAMGREPSATELTNDLNLLRSASLSGASREVFATGIFADIDYRQHAYDETRFELLRSNDSLEMALLIATYDFLLSDSVNIQFWPILNYEKDRMLLTLDAKNLFLNNSIDIKEVHKRLVNNNLFDQLNMGSQNFVLAVFQQLINREPTQSELQSGVAMVDGNNSVLFLQTGNSKEEFLDIVLNSLNYYEGQVIQLYEKYLLRTPNSYEMSTGTQSYYLNQDYVKVQKDLIKTNEFIGLN